ncbi:MAG: DUF3244 domain-containing protein [Clostridia bacterium]|nr:DUF3244 domain-containing protein [Clostridia bacterium]
MKKETIILLIVALVASSFNYSSASCYDGDDEIIIEEGTSHSGTENEHHRTVIPIQVFYSSALSAVNVYFFDNLGDVTVEIENTDTAEYHSYLVDSSLGGDSFIISGDPGHYTITFTLANGTEYIGEWEL